MKTENYIKCLPLVGQIETGNPQETKEISGPPGLALPLISGQAIAQDQAQLSE